MGEAQWQPWDRMIPRLRPAQVADLGPLAELARDAYSAASFTGTGSGSVPVHGCSATAKRRPAGP